jgi:hypothetical protein
MASGDVVLTVIGAVVTSDGVTKTGNSSVQNSSFGSVSGTTISTPNGSDIFVSANVVVQKNTAGVGIETPFDASKTYKIVVTEV